MSPVLLSIILPCFNEGATVDRVIDRLQNLARQLAPQVQLEIIAVDDASGDDTCAHLEERGRQLPPGSLQVVRHPVNRGKGAAIRTARLHVRGDIVLIQDADLEYDPSDIPSLIGPILEGRADSVIGTRFGGSGAHRVLYFWHRVANGLLTLYSNMTTDLNLTDMEVGYKAFTREAFDCMRLTNDRFGIEPEIVARLAQMGARVYEIPVSYHGRTYEEGKKITWRDGLAAVAHITRARLSRRRQEKLSPHSRHASATAEKNRPSALSSVEASRANP